MKYEFKSTTQSDIGNKIVIYRSCLYDRKDITIRIINTENSESCDLSIEDAKKLSVMASNARGVTEVLILVTPQLGDGRRVNV